MHASGLNGPLLKQHVSMTELSSTVGPFGDVLA